MCGRAPFWSSFLALFLLLVLPAAGQQQVRIAGRIVASGGPATDLRLYAERPPLEGSRAAFILNGEPSASPRQEIVLGPDGNYRIGVPGEPHFRLVAVEGELWFEREIRGAATLEIETLQIPSAQSLEGQVVGPAGEPLAGAVVYLEKVDFRQIAPWKLLPVRALTDEKGQFRLPFFPQSRLVAFARGFAPRGFQLDDLARSPRSFRLEKTEARRVWVYRDIDLPQEGVLVATGDGIPLGRTDAKGQTELWVAADSALVLNAEALRGARWTIEKPSWKRGELRTFLGGYVVFTGTVLTANGEPCVGAAVDLRTPGLQGPSLAEARTDARGFYRLGPIDPKRFRRFRGGPEPSLDIRILSPGHARRTINWAEEAGGFMVELPLQQLALDVEVSGRVVDSAGDGVEGAAIYVWSQGAPGRQGVMQKPDQKPDGKSAEDGSFSVAGVAAGEEVSLEVRAQGFLPRLEHQVLGGMAGVEVGLEKATALEVKVLSPEGQPVPRAWVSVFPVEQAMPDEKTLPSQPLHFSTTTDERGVASLPEVQRGKHFLSISADGFLDLQKEIELGDKALELEEKLSRGCSIEGTVFDAEGRPAARANIEINSAAVVGSMSPADENGHYLVSGLLPGTATVVARTRTGAGQVQVELAEGAKVRIDIHASRALFQLSGVLVKADGAPVAGRLIRLAIVSGEPGGAQGMLSHSISTASDGSFRFEIAEARRYRVDVLPPGDQQMIWVDPVLSIDVDLQQSQTLRLVLPE